MNRPCWIVVFGAAAPLIVTGAFLAVRSHAQPILLRNVTPSMPLGLYRRSDRPVRPGLVVAVRQPPAARAYLKSLGFPSDALLLKRVVIDGGDRVCASGDRVWIGQLDLPRLDRDRLGQTLPKWNGCRHLTSGELFLQGDDARSFDSRYFGPVFRGDVVGVYEHLP